MSNTLSKIHYGALIQTNSDKTSSTIGLFNGVFFYTTDGYVPSETDSWESGYTGIGGAEPDELPWNTDLMSADGLSSLGSKIDIISGGDYAFLQNASVKLVNQTELGNTVHKTIELTSGLSPIGSTMVIYCIIDGVWFPRWTGMVSGTVFNDTHFTFAGADEKSNATDTLTNTIIGLIDAEVEYTPIGELIVQNLIAYRFDENGGWLDYNNYTRQNEENSSGSGTVGEVLFNGLGDYSSDFVISESINHSVKYILADGVIPPPPVGGILKYESSSKLYSITDVYTQSEQDVFGNKIQTCIIEVAIIDNASTDYTFLFGDPLNEHTGEIALGLDTLTSKEDGEKCYFSLYKASTNTGIDASTLDGSGKMSVISNGVEYEFGYTTNDEGGTTLDNPVSVNVVLPTKIQYFTRGTDIFETNTSRDWLNFETALETADDITGQIPNDIDPTSTYKTLGNASDSQSVFHYFYMTFNADDVKDRENLQVGAIIKGFYEGDGQAWESNGGVVTDWFRYKEGDYTGGGSPTHPSQTQFANATELASTQTLYTNMRQYRITTDLTYGQIPLLDADEAVFPNIVSNDGTCVEDTVAGYKAYSFEANSKPVTNMPHYDYNAYTTYSNIFTQDRQTNVGFAKMYQSGTMQTGSLTSSNTVSLLVAFYADNNQIQQECKHITGGGVLTSEFLQTQQRLIFNINSLCIFDTVDISESDTTITYRATDSGGDNSYTDVLSEVSNGGDITALGTARDTWLAGLQVKEQQQRYKVVTNLCKQGFVGGYTSRKGVDTYRLIGDNTDTPIDITNDNTLRNTIKNFKSSPIAKVYNEFELTGSFGELSVKSVKEASFPDAGDDYSEFVVGVDDYSEARELWETARRAYLDTGAIHKAPSDRTSLDFASTESSISVYADEYLDLLIDWTAYPKLQTTLAMPLTAETVKYELLDYVNFNDPIITPDSGEVAEGWITSIDVVPKKDLVNIQLTMSPDFYIKAASTCTTITEASTNTDTITEASTNTDTITEHNCF